MNWSETCAVVIPSCDEEGTIARLVAEARQFLPTVIVVDDGSEDETGARAAAAGAQVVRQPASRGKGAALNTGVAAALGKGCSWGLTMDGDGQHRAEDIPTFLRCHEQTGASLVIGNRMGQAEAIPWLRRAVNRWLSRRISKRAGKHLPDSQCGFRLIELKVWQALGLKSDHFEIESELLLGAVRAGYRVEFIPIQAIGRGSHSHIHPLLDTWRWLRWWRRSRA